ncbi:MAG: UPF0175 family protein [Candidatus Bipolaricaulota bacterium]|nr:UPF0175 family protein [Candidatus Bipolaricaulota bacterium]MDW8140962.1 UPF0175 family protein [Candidatus Bipolaricaulota bacterium]
MPKVTLDLDPEKYQELLEVFDFSPKKLSAKLKETLAIMLFQTGRVSLGKAAELADLSLTEMIERLVQLGIPVYEYDEEEWAIEKKSLHQWKRKPSL